MYNRIFSKASIPICLLWVSSSPGAELRTYSFVADAPAYMMSCGECSGPPHAVRAQVEGTFAVSLDNSQGVGTLLSLDARLTNAEGSFGPDTWQPIEWQQEFFGGSRFYDRYRPPFSGLLKPAEYRPLGPGTLTDEHREPFIGLPGSEIPQSISYLKSLGVGFEPAPENSWILAFDGVKRSPDGQYTSIVSSYSIYIEGDEAFFSYYVPIIDAVS